MEALFAFQSASHALAVFLPAAAAVLCVIPAGAAVVAAVSVPARHSVMKSFLVLPLACRVSLFAIHSAPHALIVFAERVRRVGADEFGVSGCAGCAAVAGAGSADAVSARHSTTKSFFFLPLAWME